MGTLSTTKLSSNPPILIASPIMASLSPSPTTAKLSQISLKGKMDLSLWRGGGDDEDDDIDSSDVGLTTSQTGPSPQPPASPLLVSLLARKKSVEESNTLLSPSAPPQLSPGGIGERSTQVSQCPVVIVSEVERAGNGGNQRQTQGNNLPGDDNDTLASSLKYAEHTGKRRKGAGGGGGGGTNTATQGGNGLSTQRESGFAVHHSDDLIGNKSNNKPFNPSSRQYQPPPVPSFLSRVDSSQQLLKTESPRGRERPRSAQRKVEFTSDSRMEQSNNATSAPPVPASIAPVPQGVTTDNALSSLPVSASEKAKRGESAKDGPSRSRSGSARRPTSRTQDILQEIRKMSLASQDALDEKKKAAAAAREASHSPGRKFGRKRNKRRREEEYTDKDRAAAVTLGSKDIKQSLKAKKKRDRKLRLSISFMSGEDYVIGALVGEANYQMRVKKQPEAALGTLNKALEIQPNHKGALVARSQCYLKLGDAESALKDAERTWDPNQSETYTQGLYQYAEALFQLGEFEKALIAFHRGHRVRKDMDGFRIGIQKCQEAIRRAIGDKSATAIPNLDTVLPLIQELETTKTRLGPDAKEEVVLKNIAKYKLGGGSPSADSKVKSKLITRELMGQLYLDKSYLSKFINRPEVINQQGLAKGLRDEACDALKYLESRERFWRQQNPLYSRKSFSTMLKAHAHDAACREKSVSAEPSVAKYLQRRSSAMVMPILASPPRQRNVNSYRAKSGSPRPSRQPLMRRRASEPPPHNLQCSMKDRNSEHNKTKGKAEKARSTEDSKHLN